VVTVSAVYLDPSDYTAAQIIAAITLALRAHDVEAVGGLLQMLAAVNPDEAQAVHDIVQVGLMLTREGLLDASEGGS
jgi:hypothetical protein